MGYAATLFYNADPEVSSLHRRIVPSDEQYEEQVERWNALADWLIERLGRDSDLSTDTKLQGSYQYGTQISPRKGEEFDIDLGFLFKWRGGADEGNFGPYELKEMVQDALHDYAEEHEEVRKVAEPKTRCCRIHYQNSFHIDVPVYHLDTATNKLSLATEDDEWEESDPKALYLWYKNLVDDDYSRDKLRRQIRYLKAWASLKFSEDDGRPSSIMLTVLTAQAFNELGDDAEASDDDLFGQLVAAIHERIESDSDVPNPVNTAENINRLTGQQYTNFLVKLQTLKNTATRAANADSRLAAADIWQEAFEFIFPMPEELTTLTEQARQLPAVQVLPEIRVIASSADDSNVIEGLNSIGPVPKHYSLHFEVTNYDQLPQGSETYWIARNSGREAELQTDMGHKAGYGRTAIDATAYSGTHHMDCVVRRNGQTIAMRRVPVVISGAEPPRRNLLRNPPRPAWVALRTSGRR